MRILLTGGGTAGHINPALAIAQTVRRNDPGAVIRFVGVHTGKEAELVPREGYELDFVESKGFDFSRLISLDNLKAAFLALYSPHAKNTVRIIKEFQPDIVIGTGGYACWPIMAAAARMHIPTAVHESNALPGKAVKKLQHRVDCVWTNFECTAEQLKTRRVLRVGNPLRGGFGSISKAEARRKLGISEGRFFVLSFGGSLGAEEVNSAVLRLMSDFCAANPDILHLHASGTRDYLRTMEDFRAAGLANAGNCILTEYIHDMAIRMAAADLVISRAGAMTLSELALMKKACILIPSPHVAENHQYLNAKALADRSAALLVEESTLSEQTLTHTVSDLYRNREKIRSLEQNIPAFADLNANRRIWDEIVEMTRSSRK